MSRKLPPPEGAISYDLDGAADVTGLSRNSLYRAVKSGELPAKRSHKYDDPDVPPGGKIIVLRRELEAFIENLPEDWWGLRF